MPDARIEVDFDHRDALWLATRHAHNDALRRMGPVVWNTRYGGYWYVTGYDEVTAISRDAETFTMFYRDPSPDDISYIGMSGIPRVKGAPPIGIAETTRERHALLRRLLNPFLLPRAVASHQAFAEQAVSWLLDQKISLGRMEMVEDLTSPVPALLTMKLIGIPLGDYERYAKAVHGFSAFLPRTPEHRSATSMMPGLLSEIVEIARRRRSDPRDDIISAVVALEESGRPLGDDEVVGIVWNLVAGGLDTTTSLTTLALYDLHRHPDVRARLAEDPIRLHGACEEYLRLTSVNETLTLTCTKDTEVGGQLIRRGDHVMISWLGSNLDPAIFDEPARLVIDRTPNPHLAFGTGAHRCLGMHVARMLFRAMVGQVLDRIGDYRVDEGRTRFYEGNPLLAGVTCMPVTFTPGRTVGARSPL